MRIYSEFHEPETFTKLRRTRWLPFRFLASGEWSQTPFHSGEVTFEYSTNKKHSRVALLRTYFPRTIICISEIDEDEDITIAIGHMMFHLWENGGDYIDLVYDQDDDEKVDFSDSFELFEELISGYLKRKKIEKEIEALSYDLAGQVSQELMAKLSEDPDEKEILDLLGADPEVPRAVILRPRPGDIDDIYIDETSEELSKLSSFQLFQICKELYIEGLTEHEKALDLFCIKFELESRGIEPPIELEEILISILPSKYYLI